MFDESNGNILGRLMGYKGVEYRSREFREEYRRLVKPVLKSWYSNKPYQERLVFDSQAGGTLYTLSTEKESVEVEVEEMVSLTENEDGEEVNHRIIFFHPKLSDEFRAKGGNFMKHCLLVKIYREVKMAEISDLNRYYPCFDSKLLKHGRTMIRGVLFFLGKYKKRLGIETVELQDNSGYWCDGYPKYNIDLMYSRQLLGDYPYYWQFGFRPVSERVTHRILKNIELMDSLSVDVKIDGNDFLNYLVNRLENVTSDELYVDLGDDFWDILSDEYSRHTKLLTFLRWFSGKYCKLYSVVYRELFAVLRLTDPYSGLDSGWKLDL